MLSFWHLPRRCKVLHAFDACCLLASTWAISNCVLEYLADEDSTSVEFRRFDATHDDQGYPSFSLCLLDPYLKNELESYGEGIDISHYRNASFGYVWDPQVYKIDYDFVTVDLNKNVIFRQEWNERFKQKMYRPKNIESSGVNGKINDFYVSHRCPWGKCFSQDLPYGDSIAIAKHDIWINMDIFANKTLPPGREEVKIWNTFDNNAFGIIFHLPYQLTRSIRLQSTAWDFDTKNAGSYKYHVLRFTMKSLQVIKKRHKPSSPCEKSKTNDDEDFYSIVMNQVGCRPPFMKSSMHLPNCSSKEQLIDYTQKIGGRMAERYLDDGYTTQPCTILESLDYTYSYNGYSSKEVKELYPQEEDLAELLLNASSAVKLEFNFRPKRFQLMTNGKKYTWDAMIGNAGIKINLIYRTCLLQYKY